MRSERFDEAEETFLEALEIAQRLDHPTSIVKVRGSLGMARAGLGHLDQGIEDLRAALALARRNGLDDVEGPTRMALEEALARRGDESGRREADAGAGASAAEDPMTLATRFAEDGIRACRDGSPASGRVALEKAVAIFGRLESKPNLVQVLGYLGMAQQAQGDVEACMQTYMKHLHVCAQLDDFRTAGPSIVNISDILIRLGQPGHARPLLEIGLSKIEDESVLRELSERLDRLAK